MSDSRFRITTEFIARVISAVWITGEFRVEVESYANNSSTVWAPTIIVFFIVSCSEQRATSQFLNLTIYKSTLNIVIAYYQASPAGFLAYFTIASKDCYLRPEINREETCHTKMWLITLVTTNLLLNLLKLPFSNYFLLFSCHTIPVNETIFLLISLNLPQ